MATRTATPTTGMPSHRTSEDLRLTRSRIMSDLSFERARVALSAYCLALL
jgi:hypothetical protein